MHCSSKANPWRATDNRVSIKCRPGYQLCCCANRDAIVRSSHLLLYIMYPIQQRSPRAAKRRDEWMEPEDYALTILSYEPPEQLQIRSVSPHHMPPIHVLCMLCTQIFRMEPIKKNPPCMSPTRSHRHRCHPHPPRVSLLAKC